MNWTKKTMVSQSEFIREYCRLSKIDEKRLNELGQFSAPCNCLDDGCWGWKMTSVDDMRTDFDLNRL